MSRKNKEDSISIFILLLCVIISLGAITIFVSIIVGIFFFPFFLGPFLVLAIYEIKTETVQNFALGSEKIQTLLIAISSIALGAPIGYDLSSLDSPRNVYFLFISYLLLSFSIFSITDGKYSDVEYKGNWLRISTFIPRMAHSTILLMLAGFSCFFIGVILGRLSYKILNPA